MVWNDVKSLDGGFHTISHHFRRTHLDKMRLGFVQNFVIFFTGQRPTIKNQWKTQMIFDGRPMPGKKKRKKKNTFFDEKLDKM